MSPFSKVIISLSDSNILGSDLNEHLRQEYLQLHEDVVAKLTSLENQNYALKISTEKLEAALSQLTYQLQAFTQRTEPSFQGFYRQYK